MNYNICIYIITALTSQTDWIKKYRNASKRRSYFLHWIYVVYSLNMCMCMHERQRRTIKLFSHTFEKKKTFFIFLFSYATLEHCLFDILNCVKMQSFPNRNFLCLVFFLSLFFSFTFSEDEEPNLEKSQQW